MATRADGQGAPPPAVTGAIVRSDSLAEGRTVRPKRGRWLPPEAIMPEDVRAVIAAASCERDRLLMRVMWATAGRVSEVITLRPKDIRRDALTLPNRKNPRQPVKTVFLSASDRDLPGELLLFARDEGIADDAPLFRSRQSEHLSRQQAWAIVKEASRRAGIAVLAMRSSKDGAAGEPAPVHPHLFRHARVRQIMRTTKSLPLAKRQAGWAVLQMAYLSIGDEEARTMMGTVEDR